MRHAARLSVRTPLGAALALASLPVGGLIAGAPDNPPGAPASQTLFIGADVTVGRGKDLSPVVDVFGSSWVVDIGGHREIVTAAKGPISIKLALELKMTDVSVTVSDLKSERGYTFDNDPSVKLTRALSQAANVDAGYHAAANQAQAARDRLQAQSGIGGNINISRGIPADVTSYHTTSQMLIALSQASASQGSGLEMTGDHGAADAFDAMVIDFGISSARLLGKPYVITIAQFHEKGSPDGSLRNLVYAQALDPIDAHPKHIHILEGGFPPAFELTNFQVHIYDHGRELASNVAPKHMTLTGEEAFEYFVMDYVSTHPGETIPASVVAGTLPPDLPTRLARGKYRQSYYARISRRGLAKTLYTDEACSKEVDDDYLKSLVQGLRFKPALDGGFPTSSVLKLKLAELRL
jgi:hypothetical protein